MLRQTVTTTTEAASRIRISSSVCGMGALESDHADVITVRSGGGRGYRGGILWPMIANADTRDEVPRAQSGTVDGMRALALARDVLDTEARAIAALAARLGAPFVAAVELMRQCRGRVVVSGIGKSGHIARKLAATLASTGTPAFFVHPAEAGHGDLGMITADDVVVMLSNSGETDELV